MVSRGRVAVVVLVHTQTLLRDAHGESTLTLVSHAHICSNTEARAHAGIQTRVYAHAYVHAHTHVHARSYTQTRAPSLRAAIERRALAQLQVLQVSQRLQVSALCAFVLHHLISPNTLPTSLRKFISEIWWCSARLRQIYRQTLRPLVQFLELSSPD